MRVRVAKLLALCARRSGPPGLGIPGSLPQARPASTACAAAAAPPEHGRPDHLTRTADEPRGEAVTEARIVEVREETPTVRELGLEVADQSFTFKAGNWVDFIIDGVERVGGYSMCSVPSELPRLRLAVKRSAHPPAAWCHSDAAVPGAVVQLKAGGHFQWDPAVDGPTTEHLLLVAGGIGINPIYSIAQAALAAAPGDAPRLRCVSLLYSAARPSELAFRGRLEALARADARLRLALRVTRNEDGEAWAGATGRLDAAALLGAIAAGPAAPSGLLAYVCGPPEMTDSLVAALRGQLGLAEGRVRFERWW